MDARPGEAGPGQVGHRLPVAGVIALAAFAVFNLNGREIATYDSQASKLAAVEFARRGTLTLNHVVGRTPELGSRPAFAKDRRGNTRPAYPPASVLAAAATAWGLSACRLVDLDAPFVASLVAKLTASGLAAITVALAFLAAARRLPPSRAVLVAVAFGLGTGIWSGVSQTLWQQETALLGLMAAVATLAVPRLTAGRIVLASVFLGLAGAARPQVTPTVVVVAAGMLVRRPRWSTVAAMLPIVVAAAASVTVNLAWFGHPLGAVPAVEALHPGIHAVTGSIGAEPWWAALGLLASPSRGLVVFSPVVLVAVAGVVRARQEGWRSDLAWCLAAAAAQFGAYAFYSVWWGGHTYGPRYALDMLPCLVLPAAAGLPSVLRRTWWRAIAAGALAWSIAVAGLGAFVYPAERWNTLPEDVDRHHERLWDWRDPQIVRALRSDWNPQNFRLFSREAIRRADARWEPDAERPAFTAVPGRAPSRLPR